MGNNYENNNLCSGITFFIDQEFQRLIKTPQQQFLTISDMLELKHPEDRPISFNHLGNLFVADFDKDGRYSKQDLYQFTRWCQNRLKGIQTHEFQANIQAATTLQILKTLQKHKGEELIVDWVKFFYKLTKCMLQNDQGITFPMIPNVTYVRIQNVKLIFEIFNIKILSGLDMQAFFQLLLRASQELDFVVILINQIPRIQIDGDQNQEYVPLRICKQFITQLLKGFLKLTLQINFLIKNEEIQ